ncbi:MAG: glycoside hydrolase family 2 TIM barrel-domain containing protein [Muribaculaceae bacterium]
MRFFVFRVCVCLLLWMCAGVLQAQRCVVALNDGWKFRFSHQVDRNSGVSVTLPHTWNAADALSGKIDYKRGIGNYERRLNVRGEWQGKRVYVRFAGANSVANVFVNGKHVGEHRGGYSAFVFEITDFVQYGKENVLLVRVSNAETLDVMPLVGDFNMYGGLYRGVELVVAEPVGVSLTDYASPGVYLRQSSVDEHVALVDAVVKLANGGDADRAVDVRVAVRDAQSNVVAQSSQRGVAQTGDRGEVTLPLRVAKPHLWNGVGDAYLYDARVEVWADGKLMDAVSQPLGLRRVEVDANRGFVLNGKHLPLHGVCRHQDRAEIGNALRAEHHLEDMLLMREMGANAIRLAHYQQSEDIYSLADRYGMVVWAEIPFVGPGGYADKGFVDQESFKQNGEQQLRELIRQNYNHPSICMWGLFNELVERGDNPIEYIKQLNVLAHAEDSTRPTTAASNQGGGLNFLTDLIAWNRYDGWYGSRPAALAEFLDATHSKHPELRIGVSEYGAGASIYHQQEELKQPSPSGYWHPENWQTYFHIENYRIIAERPFVWGSFVWNMFDFGAAHRTEGDRNGINDKGLVTFDRKTKKDAFYFYKANWTAEPMVYVANRRATMRSANRHSIVAFANVAKVELLVNGKSHGVAVPDEVKVARWDDVPMNVGENTVEVRAVGVKRGASDKIVVMVTEE